MKLLKPIGGLIITTLFLLLSVSGSVSGQPASRNWIGSGDGVWNDGRNWSGGVIPAPGDDVVINQPGSYIVTLDVDADINSLSLGTGNAGLITLSITGHNLTVGAGGMNVLIDGVLQLNSGTFTGNGPMTVAGELQWNGGVMAGTGSLSGSGRFTLASASPKALNDLSITASSGSLIDWQNGELTLNSNASISVLPGANFLIQQDNTLSGGSVNISGGILEKTIGSGTAILATQVNNSGNLLVDSGTLQLMNGGSNTGSFTASSGATLQFSLGTHFLDGADFNGPGTILVDGATLDAVPSGTLLVKQRVRKPQGRAASGIVTLNSTAIMSLVNGTLTGDGDWQFDGALNWSGGTISGIGATTFNGPLNLLTGATKSLDTRTLTLTSLNTTTWTGGNISTSNSPLLDFQSGSTWNIQTDNSITGSGTIELGGILTKSDTSGTTTIQNTFNSHNSININTGTLQFTVNGSHDSPFNIASGSVLRFSSGTHTFTNAPIINGPGQMIVEGATLDVLTGSILSTISLNFIFTSGTLTGAGSWLLSNLEWQGGNITGNGTFQMSGPLNLSTTSTKSLITRTLTIPSGQVVTWIDGNISPANGAILDFQAGSTFDIQANNTLISGGTLELQGTLNKYSTGLTSLQSVVNNHNTVNINNGTLQLAANGSHGSQFNITTAGSILHFNGGTHTLNNVTFSGPGQVLVSNATLEVPLGTTAVTNNNLNFVLAAGTLTGAGDWLLSNLEWQGGSITGDGALQMSGPLNVSGTATKNLITRTLTIPSGQVVTWIDGNISPANGAILDFQAGSTLDIQGNNNLLSGGTLELHGTLNKYSTGLTSLQSVVNNHNTININNGTLQFTANGNHGSQFNVATAGSVLHFNGGTHTLNSVTFTGPGQMLVDNATLDVPLGSTAVTDNSLDLILAPGSGGLTGAGDWTVAGLNWHGGQISGDGAFVLNGPLNFMTFSTKTLDKRIITIPSGFTATWLDGGIDLNTNGLLDFQAGAIFDIQGNNTLFSGGQIANAGTLRKTAGNGTTTLDSPLVNIGLVSVNSGILNINNGYTQTAGTLLVDHAVLTSPTLPLLIQDGELSGDGLIIGNVTNQGNLSPGLGAGSIGQLTIQGSYTQTATGSLLMDLGGIDPGVDMDQLAVNGASVLDGTLDVALLGGFTPVLGDDFVLLNGTTTGAFVTTNFPIPPADTEYQLTSLNPVILSLVGTGSQTLIVNSTDDVDDGACDATHCSLREAIAFAELNSPFTDTIDLTGITGTITLLSQLPALTESVDLNGPGAALLNIDRGLLGHVFEIDSPNNDQTFIFSQLTLSRGLGGAANGGVMRIEAGDTVQISDSVIEGGNALKGGGIYNAGNLTLNHTTLSNNQATLEGGALYNTGILTLQNSTLSGNSATATGGALCNGTVSGITSIVNSTFSGNTAAHGSAIGHEGLNITLNNVTITNNTGTDNNGNEAALLDVIGNLVVKNSIVANNTPFNCTGVNSIGEFNLESGIDCGFSGVNDVQNADPLLGSLQNNTGSTATHALLAGSPAVDSANDAACEVLDQRGVNRPQDGNGDGTAHCDMGAYELLPIAAVNSLDDSDDGACDNDHCSLREAINTANAFPGLNGIDFNLSGMPPFVINPTSALPEITDAVVIDGATQPGFAGTPIIQIDGNAISGGADGLVVSAGDSVLRGLAVTRFVNGVIFAGGGNNRLENSFIGTDTTGSASGFGNSSSGVVVTASNNNFIGEVGKGNVIVGNGNFGLLLISNASGNQVIDNRIGIDLHDLALGNGQGGIGLVEAAHHNTIGLSDGAGRNFIAGNGAAGILIQDSGSDHNVIQRNFIGTDSSGLSGVSNTGNGITIGMNSSHNLIGDIFHGGNLIAFNLGAGIGISGNSIGNALYTNRIHSNTGLGIDLNNNGVTANDVLDGDTGPNNLQNYPVLTSAVLSGSNTVISGTFNSSASTAFTLELFQNSSCDSTTFGEGEQPIQAANIQTDINGNASFTLLTPAIALNQSITAIVTRVAIPLDSSEFSQCVQVTAPTSADLQVTKTGPTSGLVGEPASYQITVENLSIDTAADNVVLTDSISGIAVQFNSITQSQGQCSHGTSDVGCSLGSLAAGASATVTVELLPLAAGTLVNQATVSADTADPVDANNHASVTTLITDPVVNHAPIAHSKTVNTAFNTAVGITLTGTDADNDALSFSLLSQPEQGTLSGTAPNLLYTPNPGFSGQDSFSFKVNDGQVDSEPASVNITVQAEAANQAPQALNLNLVTAVETAVGITLSGSDADGDPLSFRIISNPNHGSLSGLAPNLSYTPDPLFTGIDQFSFVVNDGQADSAVAIVMINVINPELVVTPESLPDAQVGVPYTFNWVVSGGTPPYTIQLEGVPDGLNFVADSLTLEGTPTTAGDFSLTLTIVDQLGQNFSHSYPLRINAAPLDLTITTNSLPNAVIGFEYLQILAASGGQAPYQWQVAGLPSGLSATADGLISGQAEQAGLFVVSVTVTDALQQNAQTALNLAVVNQGLLPLTTQLPHILANQTVDIPILLTGGIPPYHCELAPGSTLPPDLVLNDCLGSLEGQVREPGQYTFTINATDSSEIPLQGSVTLTLSVIADTPIPAGEAPVLEEAGATQVPDLSTTQPGAGFADESLENLASDLLGHRYVTGFAYNGKDYDIQLLQFDRNGHVLWRQVFDAGSHEYGYGLAVSPYDQSIFVAGLGLVGNRYQAILLNYDTTGVLRWQKTLSESAADALYAVVADQTGVYAVGERYNGHDFDALIARFNQSGDLQWQTLYTTQTNDTAYHADLSCTPACVLSVVGAQGVNGRSGWIARVSPADGLLQTTQLIPEMAVLAVQTLSNGDVVIGGTQANNWLLQRLDHTLTPVWQSTVDQGADDLLRALAVDREDFIYAVGRSSNGRNNDAAVVALQPSGQVITELLFDQGQDERAYAVDIDSEGQLFVAGQKLSRDNSEFLILRVQNGKSIEAIDLE